MSAKTDEILKLLKTLTRLEAAELTKQIEDTFGVDASGFHGSYDPYILIGSIDVGEPPYLEYDVVLEEVPTDKRIGILKVLRSVTDFGLKEAKNFVDSVPQILKVYSKDEAEDIKKNLAAVGAKVSIH